MLTVDFNRLGVRPGTRVLDLGCGAGRHAFELYRRGTQVIALDRNRAELDQVTTMFDAMFAEGQVPDHAVAKTIEGDALALPFDDGEFDHVIASEVLEHIPDDRTAINELVRVLKPGGTMAVTVPTELPERICWLLSKQYHTVEGGHVRIYSADVLKGQIEQAGMISEGRHHAHALHSPYWWLKCLVGVDNERNPFVRAYHQLLVWDMTKAPRITRTAERWLNPVLGKSVVLYFRKPQ